MLPLKQEKLQSNETRAHISLGEYLTTHLDCGGVAKEVKGIGPVLVEYLIHNFCLSLDQECYIATRFPDDEFLIYFDHPARFYSYFEDWPRILEADGWLSPIPSKEQLDYLYRRCFYAYLAFGLGLEGPPKTRDEMASFEERYLTEDTEVLIKEPGQEKGVVFACKARPLAEIPSGTVYERTWTVRVQKETDHFD